MSPDDPTLPATTPDSGATPQFDPVDSGNGFTAEEQAQFDAMRSGAELPTAPPAASPSPDGSPAAAPAAPAAGGDQATGTPPQADPNDPDRDIEVTLPEGGKPQKRVSIHKFQRMEGRATEAERQLAEIREQLSKSNETQTRLDERLKIINEALATPGAPQPGQPGADDLGEMPDPEKDIFGAFQWLTRFTQQQAQQMADMQSSLTERESDADLASTYQQSAASFAQTEPAFAEAYVHLISGRVAELKLHGMTDEKAIKQQIVREEKGLVRKALENGQNPAKTIFDLALARGFVRKAAAAAPGNGAPPGGLDTATAAKPTGAGAVAAGPVTIAPGAPSAKPVPSVTAEIEAIKNGQQASQSLSTVGGGAPNLELTPEVLANMSEEEFNDLLDRLPRSRIMELMGN